MRAASGATPCTNANLPTTISRPAILAVPLDARTDLEITLFANLLALTGDDAVVGPFNVCSGEPRSVLDMATALCEAFETGRGARRRPEVVGGYRLGDVRHVFASPERAADVLGFRAVEPFAEGVAEFATAPLRAT